MATKKNKIKNLNVEVRKVDNGYTVESFSYTGSGSTATSAQYNKTFVYTNKEEAVASAVSLLNVFTKDLA